MAENEMATVAREDQSVGGFWDDILSIAVNVADVAVKVLPLILSDKEAAAVEFLEVGPLRFGSRISGNSLVPFVENIGTSEYSLVLNKPGESNMAMLISMKPSGHFGSDYAFSSKDFGTYAEGAMTAVPATPKQSAAETGVTKMLGASVSAIGFAVAANIFPGFSLSVSRRTQGPYMVTFTKQDTFVLHSAKARITDAKGNSGSVSVNPKALAATAGSISLDLPGGIRPEPSYGLYCEIEVDETTYQQMLAR